MSLQMNNSEKKSELQVYIWVYILQFWVSILQSWEKLWDKNLQLPVLIFFLSHGINKLPYFLINNEMWVEYFLYQDK